MAWIQEFISEYFFRARDIVSKFNPDNTVVIQFFQRKDDVMLFGIEECLKLLKEFFNTQNIRVRYLKDGSIISNKEVVLELEGRYQDIAIYEGLLDGILSRGSSIATNSYKCIRASNSKEIICMSDRSDHYVNQRRDGKAIYCGGIRSFSSWAQAPSPDCVVYGSIPHSLIQNFEGNLIRAMYCYKQLFPKEDLIALVDFENDVIKSSLEVLREFGEELKGVRIDTSSSVRDFMFEEWEEEYGVTPNQIFRLRQALDDNGGAHVKIYVSSGFTPEKILSFEKQGVPVDGYGVGEYLLKVNNCFCADAVMINGNRCAKYGRTHSHNPKLIEYSWE